jgi:SPP1 gp7 family putative phage head morphogenesis protein
VNKSDPSKTALIRRKFVADVNSRYRSVSSNLRIAASNIPILGKTDNFTVIQERLDWVQTFLDEQFKVTLLAGSWYEKYIEDAYTKGIRRGIRYSKGKELFWLDSSSAQGLEVAFIRQVSSTYTLNTLKQKTISDLTTIIQAVKGRILSDLSILLVRGATKKDIYKTLQKTIQNIGVLRSRTVARSEVVRAQSYGLLDAFQGFGITEVKVAAETHKEFTTNENVEYISSSDYKVCPLCKPFDGKIMNIQEAYGLIPVHPNCRCSFVGSSAKRSVDVGPLISGIVDPPSDLNE